MKRLIKAKKVIGMILALVILTAFVGITGAAQTNRRSANIKSKGIIDFENGAAVIDSSDLTYLADEIDLLEDTYKTETVNALNKIGTYYKLDGTITFNRDDGILSAADAVILPFSSIIDGIVNSQSIPVDRTYSGILPGEDTETSGNISAANASNLSLGTAAWVDGELIVGTGEDNNSYYALGKEKISSIFIPSLSFSISCSANSYIADGSSVLGNTVNVSSKNVTKITFPINGLSKMTVESGQCSYALKDSNNILPDKTGTLDNSIPIDVIGYDILELSCTITSSGQQWGNHNSSVSGSNTQDIKRLRIE